MEPYTVAELRRMVNAGEFDKHICPEVFYDYARGIAVDDWTDLSLRFVQWLIDYDYITPDRIPVKNYAKRGKYFINSQPAHERAGKDGEWKQVGPYFIDTKYNAEGHIKNILSALGQLSVPKPHFSVLFRSV